MKPNWTVMMMLGYTWNHWFSDTAQKLCVDLSACCNPRMLERDGISFMMTKELKKKTLKYKWKVCPVKIFQLPSREQYSSGLFIYLKIPKCFQSSTIVNPLNWDLGRHRRKQFFKTWSNKTRHKRRKAVFWVSWHINEGTLTQPNALIELPPDRGHPKALHCTVTIKIRNTLSIKLFTHLSGLTL